MTDQQHFERQVQANLGWNFTVNLIDIAFITFSMNLVSQTTIMPVLVSELTSSKVAIGMISAIYSLGFLLPQLLTANLAERMPRKKPFAMLLGGVGERGPYLLIGLVILWLGVPVPGLTLVLFFLLLATSAASSGTATPAWFDMIAKVIPVYRRGLWFGLSQSIGALLGIAGGALSGRILAQWAFPRNYGFSFLLAFAFAVLSWGGLALTREPASLSVKPRVSLSHYLRQLPAVLRRDHNYLRFLVSRSVANLGTMAIGFFIVYGKEHVLDSIEQVGTLTAILVGSQAVMNLLWGLVGDRRGHKLVLCSAAVMMAITAATAMLVSSVMGLWVVFALLGIAMSADSVSGMNITLEFCAPEDRPTYIGLTNTLLAPARTLAPILGGWLATWAGYRGMFLVALLVSLAGAALLALWVREPRIVRRDERLALT